MQEAEIANEALRKIATPVCIPRRFSWHARIVARFYPAQYLSSPPPEEGYTESYVREQTLVRMDWADRLRALVSGNLRFECTHKTDVALTRIKTVSGFSVLPPGRIENYR